MRRLVASLMSAVVVAACTGGVGEGGADGADVDRQEPVVAGGWAVEVLRDDLERPTQVALSPLFPDLVYVAELAGGEDAGDGRVRLLAIDAEDDAEAPDDGSVVGATGVAGLLTPTGIAVGLLEADSRHEGLVVQEQTVVTTWLLDDGVIDAGPIPVTDTATYNGRSQGTLTTVDDQHILATATGAGTGPERPGDSGRLYTLGPEERTVAVGFKNAYASAIGPDDQLFVTEVGDGSYDGEAPPDELNAIPSDVWRGALEGGEPFDGGWPRCTGDGDPTAEFGATADECAGLPAPVATFPPRSTPTSVAVTSDGTVLVALWVEGRVVEVDPDTGEVTDVVTGLDGPQHLLARDDGSVLLTVHGSGHLLALRPSDAD